MKRQGFIKGSAILLAMVLITKILGLLYKIPLTNLLGGTGMGYFASAFSVFTPVFAIVVSGIPSTMARLTAENYALERFSNMRHTKRTAFCLFTIISTVAAAVMILTSDFLSRHVVGEPSTKYALMCVAPSIIFCTIMSVERGYCEGLQNMIPTAVSEVIETLFKLILGLGFAYGIMYYISDMYDKTGMIFGTAYENSRQAASAALPFIAAAAILGSSIASTIACLYILISGKIKGDSVTMQMLQRDTITDPTGATAKKLVACCLPIALISVIMTFANMIDMLTVNPCIKAAMKASPHAFDSLLSDKLTADMLPNFIYGSYTGLAVTVFGLVPTLTAMFGKSILPSLAESCAKNDKKAMQSGLTKMLIITSIIAIPAGMGIAVLSEPILRFLFGGREPEIQVCILPLSILGIAVIFLAIATPCFSILQTLGKPHKAIIIMLSGGIIKLFLNIILIRQPVINISGAAISTLVSEIFICVLSVRSVCKMTDLRPKVSEIFVKPTYAAVMCSVTAILSHETLTKIAHLQINHRFVTLFSIGIGSIMYFFCLYLLCETPKNIVNYIFSKKNPQNP